MEREEKEKNRKEGAKRNKSGGLVPRYPVQKLPLSGLEGSGARG